MKMLTPGFTLVEVMVVAFILSIGLLMWVRLFPLGLRAKEVAEQYSLAPLLGQKLMEEIKGRGYDALKLTYPSETAHYGLGKGKFKERGYQWQVEWWDTEIPNLRKVKVRILYGEPRIKKNQAVRPHLDLVTYLARRD